EISGLRGSIGIIFRSVHRLVRDGGIRTDATDAINLRKSGRCRCPAPVFQTPRRADLFLGSPPAHGWETLPQCDLNDRTWETSFLVQRDATWGESQHPSRLLH